MSQCKGNDVPSIRTQWMKKVQGLVCDSVVGAFVPDIRQNEEDNWSMHVHWDMAMWWITVTVDDELDGGWVSVSSCTGSPGWSRTKGHKTVVVVLLYSDSELNCVECRQSLYCALASRKISDVQTSNSLDSA